MKRRAAIKNIGIGMGLSVSTGTFLSMIASCKSESKVVGPEGWQPAFLTDNKQLAFVENLADIILPATDTPGAKDVGVIKYMDMALAELYEPEDQVKFKKGLETCISVVQTEQGGKFHALKKEQLTDFLENHIGSKADKTAHEARSEMLSQKEVPTGEAAQKEYSLYNFLNAVKSLTIGGYFGNEIIGTEYLTYDPIPGPYQGCIDWPTGNAYSLY